MIDLPNTGTQDMTVIENMDMDVFDCDSVRRYRRRMQNSHPGHAWETLEDEDFLCRLGAAGRSDDGRMHPTAAGLLMFGRENEIVKEFPGFLPDYRNQTDTYAGGNLYDFYFHVYDRIIRGMKIPLRFEDDIYDTPVHMALGEALANCLIHADYCTGGGVSVFKKNNRITFSNPGCFRVDIDGAISGGISDPRNAGIMKMFNLINIGGHAGNGIHGIYRVWRKWDWIEPVITESIEPARTEFTLVLDSKATARTEKYAELTERIDAGRKISAIAALKRNRIIQYLTDHKAAKTSEIAAYVHLKPSRVRDYMNDLMRSGVVKADGANRNRTYTLNI